jgi:hypothetical protein
MATDELTYELMEAIITCLIHDDDEVRKTTCYTLNQYEFNNFPVFVDLVADVMNGGPNDSLPDNVRHLACVVLTHCLQPTTQISLFNVETRWKRLLPPTLRYKIHTIAVLSLYTGSEHIYKAAAHFLGNLFFIEMNDLDDVVDQILTELVNPAGRTLNKKASLVALHEMFDGPLQIEFRLFFFKKFSH